MSILKFDFYVPFYSDVVEDTAPAGEPITKSEAKAYVGIKHDDHDDIVLLKIEAARRIVEKEINKSIINRVLIAKFMGYETEHPLPLGPVTAINSVKRVVNAVETTLTEGTDYRVQGYQYDKMIKVNKFYNISGLYMPEIHVNYNAGMGADSDNIRADVKDAVLETFKELWNARDDFEDQKTLPPATEKVKRMLSDLYDYGL